MSNPHVYLIYHEVTAMLPSFLSLESLSAYLSMDFLSDVLFYFGVALPFFLVFCVWRKQQFQPRRIQQKQRSNPQQWWREIRQSLVSIVIFGLIDAGAYGAEQHGLTLMYQDVGQWGVAYLVVSVVVMLLLQDTYFYWAHRLMHWKPLYRFTHRVHHDSIDTSPFTSYSFHPVEAIVEAVPNVVFAFLFPVHFWALLGYQLTDLILNVIGHLGYEIMPQCWTTHWLLRWKTPSTHHNMHHAKVNGNYGLYFRFWDVWMGTEFQDYPATIAAVYDRANKATPQKAPASDGNCS
jgi:Delta7-sterol 5-desaturase